MALTAEKAALLERVAAALRLSGWQLQWLNDDQANHPSPQMIGKANTLRGWA